MNISLEQLELSKYKLYAAYKFWTNHLIVPIKEHLTINLPPAVVKNPNDKLSAPNEPCCAVLSLRELTDHPLLISTSRHITQGMVDVVDENWDETKGILRGESLLVAEDPYEIRVLLLSTKGAWRFIRFEVSSSDRLAGVKIIDTKVEPQLLKVCLISPENCKVRWEIKFMIPSGSERRRF